jgi:hypothetical protein
MSRLTNRRDFAYDNAEYALSVDGEFAVAERYRTVSSGAISSSVHG